jgi:hypothetical protein
MDVSRDGLMVCLVYVPEIGIVYGDQELVVETIL